MRETTVHLPHACDSSCEDCFDELQIIVMVAGGAPKAVNRG